MRIPFFDTNRQYDLYKDSIHSAVEKVLKNGSLINGTFVKDFESLFAEFCEKDYCIATSSGTNALYTALKSFNIKDGDEVITTAFSALPTASAISQTGATPIFVDINDAHQIDTDKIEAAISRKTKAIVAVHLYGRLCDTTTIRAICDKHNLFMIEDCAQGIGTGYGNLSDIAAYSFYPTKNLGAYGDGGAIVTSSKKQADWCRAFSIYGQENGLSTFNGINNRMDDLQAAFLLDKLNRIDSDLEKRKTIVEQYTSGFKNIPELNIPSKNIPFHLYVIETSRRNKLQLHLKNTQIETLIHYPYILPELPQYNNELSTYPKALRLKQEGLSIPLFPELEQEEINYVIQKIRSFFLN